MALILDATDNPALGDILREVRSTELQRDRYRFRTNVELLGTLLAYEVGATLAARTETVTTPLGARAVTVLDDPPVLVTALRAGVPFLQGMLQVFRSSDVSFFGAARVEGDGPDEETGAMLIRLGYEALVPCAGRAVIFVDPMIATGSTVIDIHRTLVDAGQAPRRFIVAGLVGYRGAIERLEREIPGVEVCFVTCDDELDDRGYIVPGLGDAGDLCYGTKL